MTQVSANTLTYDQIYLKIRDFFVKDINKEYPSNQDKLEAYQNLLNDIQNSIGGMTSKFNPFIKGEPPTSKKINDFTKSMSADMTLISKQLDYLNAKIINAHNLFATEINTEKNYLERIASKAKVLQMYSKAPADNLVYIGDSFDNSDYVDITKVPIGLNPHIENGNFSLPIDTARPWVPRNVSIILSESNGFLGNDHSIIRQNDEVSNEPYKYFYKDNPSISSISAIVDGNPLTFFEYEGLNVDKNSNSAVDQTLLSENEFTYLSNKKVLSNVTEGELVNWSQFDMNETLKFGVSLDASTAYLANSITITPYFGGSRVVKVSAIKATKSNGDVVDLLSSPIYIGSTFAPLNNQMAGAYYYDKAIIKFSELKVLKFDIYFEQDSYETIDIGHSYWKPNYLSTQNNPQNPFYGLSRFNPDALSKNVYDSIEYDRYSIIPEITVPNQFKDMERPSKNVTVRLVKKPEINSTYIIVIKTEKNNDSNIKRNFYFYGWNGTNVRYTLNATDLLNGGKTYATEADAITDLNQIISTYASFDPPNVDYFVSVYSKITEISIQKLDIPVRQNPVNYQVPIILQNETYSAQRKAIGIRDISINYEIYNNSATIVSKPFKFDRQVDALMLDVESTVDNTYSNLTEAKYYISVNDSAWIQISPIQLSSTSIPEVLIFNKNIPSEYRLPGVGYLNYPDVPTTINSVTVKIELYKNRSTNVTPIIYSYKLIAGVKQ